MKRLTLLIVMSTLVLTAQTPTAGGDAQEAGLRQAIARVHQRWAEAFRKQNGNLFYQVFCEDGAFMGAAGRAVVGPEKIAKVMASNMELLGPAEVRFTSKQIFGLDGQFYETGRCLYRFGPRDNPQTSGGPYLSVWKKGGDGSWRIHRFVSLPDA